MGSFKFNVIQCFNNNTKILPVFNVATLTQDIQATGKFLNLAPMNKTYSDLGLLLLRLGSGLLMIPHGWGKAQWLLSGEPIEFFNFLGLGDTASLALTVGGELVAPALIVLGVFARWAAIPAAFTMAVAGFWVHAADPIGDKELSLLYFAAYAAIALMGSGKYSLETLWKKD
jgi:putative oxidoreductase